MDVAIIGIGLHRFGRSPDMSGMQQGASAVRAALADAGLSWADMQFAYGGSQDAGNADALVNELGLTGLQFTVVVGFDKHPRGAFNPQPKEWGLDDWYGETGLMLTTQFFALKTQRYMHDHGITEDALIRVSEKAFTNGSLTPTAWRQQALSYDEIANSAMISDPLRISTAATHCF
jgi:acetyl-CoA C-acetyltransferase